MEVLTLGPLTAQFINDPSSWRIYSEGKENLIADIRQHDWANDSVDFQSKAAGQLLLDTMSELRLAFLPRDAEMVKSDQGVTKDIPVNSPEQGSTLPDLEPEQNAGLTDADEILELIKMLLDDVDTSGGEPTPEHIAAYNDAVSLYQKALSDFVDSIEIKAALNEDVTAELSTLEVYAALPLDPIKFPIEPSQPCPAIHPTHGKPCSLKMNQHIQPGEHQLINPDTSRIHKWRTDDAM
jgi:hypothetical protein